MRPFCAALLVALLASCDGGRPAEGEKPKVAVSIFPIYDVARRVAGDRLDVVLVLPPGRSEHGYDPTPREMARVSGARLGVVVGLEMDPWAERIIRSAAGEGVEMLRLGPALDPRRHSAPEVGVDVVGHARAHHDEHDEGEEHEGVHHEEGEEHEGEEHEGEEHEGEEHEGEGHDEHGHGHRHGAFDPHFWLDPVRMQRAVAQLVETYSRIDPAGAADYRARGDAVREELAGLHRQLEARSRRWQSRNIVTFHGSFGYFAERYGLRISAVIEPFPGREPTPRYMQEVIEAIRASGARALFSEPQLDPRPARVIAQQAGVTLHQLDPVGGTEGVDSYERLLLRNVEVLDRALGGGG